MIKNYFTIAWRNLLKSKGYSAINIAGLAVGMAVAIVIGLWIYDELSFNTYHKNYSRIAQVMQNQDFNGVTGTQSSVPVPLGDALRSKYASDFKYVVMSSWTGGHIISYGDKNLTKSGNFMEEDAPAMLSLNMISGSQKVLSDPGSILISQNLAETIFGKTDPIGKTLKIDGKQVAKIAGVYGDLPDNTTFKSMQFIAPWAMYVSSQKWVADSKQNWGNNSFQTFVQLNDNADLDRVSSKIRNIKYNAVDRNERRYNAKMFLHPMSKWQLYSEFKNGKVVGGKIQFVWLFGIIGLFVLLLACINFMNLSTARSEKRAKEVGIRKTLGSLRGQLIGQFFSESLLVTILAFIAALILVQLSIPYFNDIAAKQIHILWTNGLFWLTSISFILFTGIIAGSYPALYLSSFQPVKVLKGTFRAGRFASLPRKALVVVQFSVSIILIIGTIIVFRQIDFAKNRPVGYDREGMIMTYVTTSDIHDHFDAFRSELLSAGVVSEVAESQGPATAVWSSNSGFNWKGKDPAQTVDFATNGVSYQFAKTVGWRFVDGRSFSKEFATDSTAVVINETAAKFTGLKNPVGETMEWDSQKIHIIGIIKDMIMESPYEAPKPTLFYVGRGPGGVITIKLKPGANVKDAIAKVESIYKTYSPSTPFDYKFVDAEYAYKFANEERIGKLATLFAGLAIFISCLGLFGMASFTAEQRTKEIGVRKVLGATITDLWKMLSIEFIILVLISCVVGAPVATYFLNQWLQNYAYHTEISWWIFAVSIFGALTITLITVSFQAVKAALANPVKSLRAE